jgi:uracil-DNA glycosylase
MNPEKVNIEGEWKEILSPFIMSNKFDEIYSNLRDDHANGITIFPASTNMYKAFKCKYEDLKVVIIADGPYNTAIDKTPLADGLALSTGIYGKNTKLLEDCWYSAIEKDLFDGMNLNMYLNPDLSFLAEQGVLLLNSSLTTREGKDSHFSLWRPFIAYLIEHALNPYPMEIPYILIGEQSRYYRKYISLKATVFECEHPQKALDEKRSWNFNNIFSKTNAFLKKVRNEEIIWAEEVCV